MTSPIISWGDWDDATRNDPYPLFEATRAKCPVGQVRLADGHDAWLVVSHAAAHQALRDPRLSKDIVTALKRLADMGQRTTNMPIDVIVDELPRFGDGVEREIIGIAQEALELPRVGKGMFASFDLRSFRTQHLIECLHKCVRPRRPFDGAIHAERSPSLLASNTSMLTGYGVS